MRILAVDIGTGTQDILLFDSTVAPENCVKMVMPSPTSILAGQARRATEEGETIILTGVMMGGGPISWAVRDHLTRGLSVLATPAAARTLDDDLARVAAMGVRIVDEGDDHLPSGGRRLVLRDLDLPAIHLALSAFGVGTRYDGLAVAVLDHGEAPPGVSDRLFRFDHIRSLIERAGRTSGQLLTFAYTPGDLPPYLTRMRSVVRSTGEGGVPLVLLDTGAAAALGALEDREVARHKEVVLLNVGNMHTLATHMVNGRIAGLFEHHTGFLTTEKLDAYLDALVAGRLDNGTIFADEGHGCFIVEQPEETPRSKSPFLAVTGPRRALALGSRLRPYLAVPHGDMMMAGCFGLVRACAARTPEWREDIEGALA